MTLDLRIIAAVSDNNVIGVKGKIPWHIPEDLRRFKELTLDHPVIMGRRTYESIPERFRPLPKRKNIVLSSSLSDQEGIYIARTIDEALELIEDRDSYVIGGRRVYELFLPYVDRLEITRVHRSFEGETFFPEVNWDEWETSNEERDLVSENERIPYSFLTYSRI